MSNEDLKKWFEEYRKSVTRDTVISKLTGHGLSASQATIMADGKWSPTKIQHRTIDALMAIRNGKRAS